MTDAFYEPTGDGRYFATDHTIGPWGPDMQHMGPPSALLAREMQQLDARDDRALRRFTVEVLGAVPVGEIEVSAQVVRPGRTIELLGAEMTAGGRSVARAWGWRLQIGDTSDIAGGAAPALADPSTGEPREAPAGWHEGYINALEWRWLRGDFAELGPGTAWARLRVPLLPDEEFTPLQRLLATVDSANGVASRLGISSWLFLNTDLSVHLHRTPTGEWIGLDANTVVGPEGAGVCSATVHDLDGPVGTSAQVLTIRRR